MIDARTKEKLQMKLYPKARQVMYEPVKKVLDQYLQPGARVLDAGCGKGTWILRDYRNKIDCWVGLDIQTSNEKTRMDELILCDLENIPISNAVFDVIICHDVIEHLRQPQKVFAEFWRVLSDGGTLVFMTPCIHAPIFLLSRWTPARWHEKIKGLLVGTQVDAFPTYYRCNTAKKLDKTLQEIGFRKEILESVEDMYYYFGFNCIAYAIALLGSRLIQLVPLAKPFRSQLAGAFCKPRNWHEEYGRVECR